MANQEHLDILNQGVDVWNQWRKEHNGVIPDLRDADLREAHLKGVVFSFALLNRTHFIGTDLSEAHLNKADLRGADLKEANLNKAQLKEAHLIGANLYKARLRGADLHRASLNRADLSRADLSRANLSGANLSRSTLVSTNFSESILTDCQIYGISVWGLELKGAIQKNLVITPADQPTITVDNLEVAQFIYLLLNNPKIRDVIDTIGKKAVLILGRFTPERKSILESIRDVLRAQGYLPILFDFPKPDSQDLTGTVSTLANLSRFIIADLTDPSCSPYEIGLIAPYMKPIKPLFQPSEAARHEFAMFRDLRMRYTWVLPVYRYKDHKTLLASLQEKVIAPAEQRALMLEKKKRR